MQAGEDEAKFWLQPVRLAANYGFNNSELNQIQQLIQDHQQELVEAWNDYFA